MYARFEKTRKRPTKCGKNHKVVFLRKIEMRGEPFKEGGGNQKFKKRMKILTNPQNSNQLLPSSPTNLPNF